MIGFGLDYSNIGAQFGHDFINSIDRIFDEQFAVYVENIVIRSQDHMSLNYNWWTWAPDSLMGTLRQKREKKGDHTISVNADQGYMLQWGHTRDSGASEIRPVNADALFINKTGLDSETIKTMGWPEFNEQFIYGVHWHWADRVPIHSMPYLRLPIKDTDVGTMAQQAVMPEGETLVEEFYNDIREHIAMEMWNRAKHAGRV